MENFEKKQRVSKLRISYLILLLACVVGAGSYGYYVYTVFRDWQLNMPQPQVEKLIKDLRLYHLQTRHFPATLNEVNELIWHTRPTPNYGNDGRRARTKNYYYYYTKVDEETCAIWALPVGRQRHYASSYFVVLSPAWLRGWKGNDVDDEAIAKLPAVPTQDDLAELKMRELPARVFTAQK